LRESLDFSGGWIIGPTTDLLTLIGAPVVLFLTVVLFHYFTPSNAQPGIIYGLQDNSFLDLALGAFSFGHTFAAAFRSHSNLGIYSRYRVRFTLVPLALLLLISVSPWFFAIAFVLAAFWDIHHRAMQTFGLGRLYDLRRKLNDNSNRPWEIAFNIIWYVGPLAVGFNLMERFGEFTKVADEGAPSFFFSVEPFVDQHKSILPPIVGTIIVVFMLAYTVRTVKRWREGHRASPQKWLLYISTSVVSIFAWGFNSFGAGFLIMSYFHALQYFFLVWHVEKKNIRELCNMESEQVTGGLGPFVYVALCFLYGCFVEHEMWNARGVHSHGLSLIVVVTLMHYWYDGFIWSVKKGDVKLRKPA